jgi:mRNA-degrading endonuclease RelE of RelBE toxin-antitoxin system
MGVKDFFMKKMLEKQMKDLPKDQQEKMIKLITENPEFFQKISNEIKQEMNSGKDQMAATMGVMRKHQAELQKIMMNQ